MHIFIMDTIVVYKGGLYSTEVLVVCISAFPGVVVFPMRRVLLSTGAGADRKQDNQSQTASFPFLSPGGTVI